MTRGQRGRLIGRAMIWLAVIAIAGTAFLFVFAPEPISRPLPIHTPFWSDAFPVLGVAGVIVGLAWMIRIYRADPEPDQRAWRYRAKR